MTGAGNGIGRLLQKQAAQPGTFVLFGDCSGNSSPTRRGTIMGDIIYIVGLIVVVLAVLSFFGLR